MVNDWVIVVKGALGIAHCLEGFKHLEWMGMVFLNRFMMSRYFTTSQEKKQNRREISHTFLSPGTLFITNFAAQCDFDCPISGFLNKN